MFAYGYLPPLMFLCMIIFMLYGFPVAFTLGAVGDQVDACDTG